MSSQQLIQVHENHHLLSPRHPSHSIGLFREMHQTTICMANKQANTCLLVYWLATGMLLGVHLSVSLFVYHPACISVCIPLCVCLFIGHSLHLSACLLVYWSACSSVCISLCVCLFIYILVKVPVRVYYGKYCTKQR